MTEEKTILTTYLQRVLALKDKRRTVPSSEDLREIAKELGLSDSDLAEVDQAAADHCLRGQGFLERQRWDDAIVELEESVALSPRNVERLHTLALAHAGKWREGHQAANRERAEKLARECLELDPRHSGSFEVLDQLDQTPASPDPQPKPKASRNLILSGLALISILAGTVFLRAPSDPPPGTEQPAQPPAPETSAATTGDVEELDIPVQLESGENDLGLELEVRQSRLKNYGTGKSFLTLNALLANRGVNEIAKLGVRLILLTAEGAVLEQDTFDVLSSSSPVLRPGDQHAIHRLRETSATLRGLRMVVETVDHNPAATTYAEAKPIPLDWPLERSGDLAITLRERDYRFSEKSLAKDGSGYFDAVLEIENTSQRTLRQLTLEVEIVGPEERWTGHHEKHVVLTSGPALRAGEVRLKRLFIEVEERPDSYRISVVSAQ